MNLLDQYMSRSPASKMFVSGFNKRLSYFMLKKEKALFSAIVSVLMDVSDSSLTPDHCKGNIRVFMHCFF